MTQTVFNEGSLMQGVGAKGGAPMNCSLDSGICTE